MSEAHSPCAYVWRKINSIKDLVQFTNLIPYKVAIKLSRIIAQGRYRFQHKRPALILEAITPLRENSGLAKREYIIPGEPFMLLRMTDVLIQNLVKANDLMSQSKAVRFISNDIAS